VAYGQTSEPFDFVKEHGGVPVPDGSPKGTPSASETIDPALLAAMLRAAGGLGGGQEETGIVPGVTPRSEAASSLRDIDYAKADGPLPDEFWKLAELGVKIGAMAA